jgi:DNA polymerase-1
MQVSSRNVALIIDGHNLLFASYYGMPDRIRSLNGTSIHGVYGFIASVLKMIRRYDPAVIAVCFDAEEKTFRNALSTEYKGNRPLFTTGSNPFTQLGDIKRGLDLLGVAWLEIGGVEADDVMGSLARKLSTVYRVYIASMDHDLYQLIDQHVCIYSRARGTDTEHGPVEFTERYKITPSQFVDFKAMVGDTSDTIKGVPGVGVKTAAELLNRFGDMHGILSNLGDLKPRIAAALESAREQLVLNKRLITIRTDFEHTLLNRDFGFCHQSEVEIPNVRQILQRLGLMA